jgi:ABC-type Mn2+/Zn2+ transport system permease subunit
MLATHLATASLPIALVTAAALGIACALLSVVVVVRRWAFIGEGIAHAGFGGAGTAWMLALAFPSATWLTGGEVVHAIAVAFCIVVALGVAAVTRRGHVHMDTAIGIFLVTSVAWGFAAWQVYRKVSGFEPAGWQDYAVGRLDRADVSQMIHALLASICVVAALAVTGKEVLAYCFDPALAEVSGVRVGFVHYLLVLLMTATIVAGMRLIGSLLMVALLVLPGATALQVSRRLTSVIAVAAAVGLMGALAGPLVSWRWPIIPAGPAVVFALVLQFIVAMTWRRVARGRGPGWHGPG